MPGARGASFFGESRHAVVDMERDGPGPDWFTRSLAPKDLCVRAAEGRGSPQGGFAKDQRNRSVGPAQTVIMRIRSFILSTTVACWVRRIATKDSAWQKSTRCDGMKNACLGLHVRGAGAVSTSVW